MEANEEPILRSLEDGWDYRPEWRSLVVERYIAQCAGGDDRKTVADILYAEKDPFIR